jgi:hypothetical protein
VSQHSYQIEIEDVQSVVVTHNLDSAQVQVRFVSESGESSNQLIEAVTPDGAQPRDVLVLDFVQSVTGRVQVIEPEFFNVT